MADYDLGTALIVTDVQNDFADPKGSLYVGGGEDVVAVANREIAGARDAGALVVYTQDWHPSSTPHFQKDGGIWPVHCVQGTWGARFHQALDVAEDAEIVRKGTGGEDGYSGFSVRDPTSGRTGRTGLEALLRRGAIRRLVILGLATDYCVKETALDGARLGFDTTVLDEGIRAVNLKPDDGENAIRAVIDAGVHVE
jgi:nicotinamidase/pyrazinamidase